MVSQAEGSSVKGSRSRVGPLALRLREGAHYFQEGPTYYWGSVNDNTPLWIGSGVPLGSVLDPVCGDTPLDGVRCTPWFCS